VENLPLDAFLLQVFKSEPSLQYNIKGKSIFISLKPISVNPKLSEEIAADRPPVHGRVVDAKGAPLQGVSVSVKGTTIGVTTNEKGEYQLTIPTGKSASLVFSFVGMEFKEIAVGDKTEINISMVPLDNSQTEVVIVGYGKQNKIKLTGAVATLKMDDVLGDRPVSNMSTLLQGATPGLQVTISSGQPGVSSSLNVRGFTDFNATGDTAKAGSPLILVDNVPLNGPLNLVDPNDIETLTVLKDAGSAAIYGARAAFGVIVITTKKGAKNQKMRVDYSNNFDVSKPLSLPQRATPTQQVQSWLDSYPGASNYAWATQGNFQTWLQLLADYQAHPENYPKGYAIQGTTYYQLAPVDQTKQLLGNSAFQQMHNIALSGGNDKTTYRLSFGSTNEKGIIVPEANQDSYKRYNVRSFVSSDATPWLNLQLDAGYNHSLNTSPFNTLAFGTATVTPDLIPDSLPSGVGLTQTGQIATAKNLLLAQYPTTNRNDDIRLTGRTILRPVNGLTITGEYTYDNLNNQIQNYDKLSTYLISQYTFTSPSVGTGTLTKTASIVDYTALNVFATYTKTFSRQHNFTLLAGFNQEQSITQSSYISAVGMLDPNNPTISGAAVYNPSSDGYAKFATQGVFGRFNYDFRNKYLLEVDGRYDGSSKFPDGHRWGFFPSISGGWRISEEKFMQQFKPW
jgi:TonB-linked SusC/RagA family outer membrane protein